MVANNPAKGVVRQEKEYRKCALELLREARLERNRKRQQEIVIPVVEVQPTLPPPTEIPPVVLPVTTPKKTTKTAKEQ